MLLFQPLIGGIVTDPTQVNLSPITNSVSDLEQFAKRVRDKGDGKFEMRRT